MAEERGENQLLTTVALLVLAAVAATVALIYTRSVMVPFVLSVFLTYLVSPLVDVLQVRARVPRGVAVLGAFLVIAVAIMLLVGLVAQSVAGLDQNLDLYRARLLGFVGVLDEQLDAHGVDLGQQTVMDALRELPVLDIVRSTLGDALNFLSTLFLVLICTIYLLLGRQPREARGGIWGEIDSRIRQYIVTKVGTSLATGVAVGLVLWLFGLDLAMVFGILTFLLNFIPSVGSVIAMALPLPVAFIQFESGWLIAGVIAVPAIIQLVIGNVIEPKLMGGGLDLHPITILLALIFWGLVWGLTGMLLAAPITAVLKIVLERFDTTRPVAAVLAGRLPGRDASS